MNRQGGAALKLLAGRLHPSSHFTRGASGTLAHSIAALLLANPYSGFAMR
jgi:hypothetical protein